ncbi:MAG TPA: Gfo/Idh/MocA family oxidoreductase [Acidimicrobiales bacterium]|nr:Gfo/Idh/MocA family oxidoreductase [Acidimicrobiales bacterium]
MTLTGPPTPTAAIGCGYWGKNIVRNLARLRALAAVSDADPVVARVMSDEYDVPALSIDEVLARDDIGAITIAAPARLHYELARRCLDAGKHVFVEKPLALDVRDAEALCEQAEAATLTLMVGHLLQYHPAFLRLRELVGEGVLGRVEYVYSNRLNLGKIRREEDILWSFAPHDISMILSIVGSEPVVAAAVGGTYLHKSIADVTTTHLEFPGGERAHVFVSWLHPFKEQKLVVVGDRGMAVFDDGEPWESKVRLYPHRIEWRDGMPQPVKAAAEAIAVEAAEPLLIELAHFLRCIERGERPRTDGWEGLRVLRVLAAAGDEMLAGSARGAPLAPPPAASRFPGVFVHESSYVDDGVRIGEGTRIWHFSHILSGSAIGRDCNLGQNVMVGPDVTIGDRCKLQNNVSVYPGVTLEDGVFCGPSCVFTNVNNPRAEIERKSEFRATVVRRGASIGANATIVCGHEIGQYAFVAAGAVVTSDVPAHALVAGVPAKRIGWMSHDGERLGDGLTCPTSGRRYRETEDGTLEEIV